MAVDVALEEMMGKLGNYKVALHWTNVSNWKTLRISTYLTWSKIYECGVTE